MTTGLPSQTQVIELLDGEFARAGYEIEDVVIDARTRPPRITVIADGDDGLDLDTAATLSRSASALLDGLDTIGDHYVLEVSSPGVDRPLTNAKHFRRARGRKVDVALSDGSTLTGRIGETNEDAVALVVRAGRDWAIREIPLGDVVKAVVQVEFSPPAQAELELAGTGRGDDAERSDEEARAQMNRAGDDAERSDEEERAQMNRAGDDAERSDEEERRR
ncbi:ribosome maturation factor RimP [Mycobacterium marseillense]|uniref:Ribosome maturation factor RimP n=1 Tax=Mycobacterium marseillense TaxID=701042 RepID=A0ABN5ZUB3_9MYCO|nr:ribosome maturation factor RimP [Mycobacterium marseillense]